MNVGGLALYGKQNQAMKIPILFASGARNQNTNHEKTTPKASKHTHTHKINYVDHQLTPERPCKGHVVIKTTT